MLTCFSKVPKPDCCQCEGECKYAAFTSHNLDAPYAFSDSSAWLVDGSTPSPLTFHAIENYVRPMPEGSKASNPKDGVGSRKVGWCCIPFTVLWEVGNGMGEGGYKYGFHNYRAAGVRASVYINATMARHLAPWWEGEDLDPDSGESHITKAICSLIVLRDSMLQGNWVDDRPIRSKPGLLAEANKRAAALADKYPNPVRPYTQTDLSWAEAKEAA